MLMSQARECSQAQRKTILLKLVLATETSAHGRLSRVEKKHKKKREK
jgi:uncharacterized protein YigA (DUF484 family)